MRKRIPNWYEWHWQNNPPAEEEQQEATSKLIDIILKKAKFLRLSAKLTVQLNY